MIIDGRGRQNQRGNYCGWEVGLGKVSAGQNWMLDVEDESALTRLGERVEKHRG